MHLCSKPLPPNQRPGTFLLGPRGWIPPLDIELESQLQPARARHICQGLHAQSQDDLQTMLSHLTLLWSTLNSCCQFVEETPRSQIHPLPGWILSAPPARAGSPLPCFPPSCNGSFPLFPLQLPIPSAQAWSSSTMPRDEGEQEKGLVPWHPCLKAKKTHHKEEPGHSPVPIVFANYFLL